MKNLLTWSELLPHDGNQEPAANPSPLWASAGTRGPGGDLRARGQGYQCLVSPPRMGITCPHNLVTFMVEHNTPRWLQFYHHITINWLILLAYIPQNKDTITSAVLCYNLWVYFIIEKGWCFFVLGIYSGWVASTAELLLYIPHNWFNA